MRKVVVAHRGDCSRAHENTLEAFADAIGHGADMIELDVRRTADGEIVVHHDDAIANIPLSGIDYGMVLQLAAAGGYRVPTLAEVVALAKGRVQLDVELKEEIGAATLDVLFTGGLAFDDFVVTSFDAAALNTVIGRAPSARTGLLIEQASRVHAFDALRRSGASFLAPECVIVDATMLSDADADGVALLPWTVNDAADMLRFLNAPAVMGIITDRLATAVRLRGSGSIGPLLH